MPDQPTMLVTGAAGFVGGRVVEIAHLAGLGHVRAGIRRWAGAARITRFPVEVVFCDILRPDQVAGAVQGVQVVVHCAYTDTRAGIVEGTRNVLEAALQAGVTRVVYLSTAEVYGPEARDRVIETHPRLLTGNVYADGKIEAEALCQEYAARGLPVTILRPSIVYGPFSDTWIVRYARRLQAGQWGEFSDDAEGFCNLVYVDDLVAAILLVARSDQAAGETFNINGPDCVTWNEYFRRLNAALGLPPLHNLGGLPLAARMEAARLVMSMVRRSGDGIGDSIKSTYATLGQPRLHQLVRSRLVLPVKQFVRATPTRQELSLFQRRAMYADDKARALLGYCPQVSLDEGLQISVAWLRHHGYVETSREARIGTLRRADR